MQTTQTDYEKAIEASKGFEPIFDRVLIKRDVSALERRTTNAGLIMPDTAKDNYKSSEGYLIKCSDTCDERVRALVGKRILFARFSGDDIKVNGEEFVLAMDEDIFGEMKWTRKNRHKKQ